MPLDISKLNTKARRNLKASRLAPMYTDEELVALVRKNYSYSEKPTLSHRRWSDRFQRLTEEANAANPRKTRKWSPEEDDFLLATYMYLTDSTIALALNIPANIVRSRRITRKLFKDTNKHHLDVMVWCERDNFERDVTSKRLLKARPDVIF